MKPSVAQDSEAAAAPLDDPLAGMLVYELRRAATAVMTALTQEFAELDLKPSEASLLLIIGANKSCRQSDIARAHRASPANLVPLIARLERDGLVERIPGPGRAIALTLTKSGRALLPDVQSRFRRIEAAAAGQLSERGRGQIIKALQDVCYGACHCDRE